MAYTTFMLALRHAPWRRCDRHGRCALHMLSSCRKRRIHALQQPARVIDQLLLCTQWTFVAATSCSCHFSRLIGDLRCRLGKVETRPGFHDDTHIWPVGYRVREPYYQTLAVPSNAISLMTYTSDRHRDRKLDLSFGCTECFRISTKHCWMLMAYCESFLVSRSAFSLHQVL